MKRFLVSVGLLFALGLAALPAAAADEARPDPRSAETVRAALEASLSRQATLLLASGQEISGTVTRVGERVVYLTKLTGRDYYDAAVLIDRVDAVILRIWGQ
jgi:hypothetical protein